MDTPTTTDQRTPSTGRRRERCETLIIGAGQAGMAVAYHLARSGRPSVLLDRHARVGDQWRAHWDSLRLYSPARYDGLPGSPFPSDDGWAFPTKDEVADFLEGYAARHGFDVRHDTRVEVVSAVGDRYLVRTADTEFEAVNVVVATGTFGRPHVPSFAADLDPTILQVHSSQYRNPDQLRPGPVLVVGASHSGADVAMELAPLPRHEPTVLCGPSHGEIPVALESRAMRRIFPLVWLAWGSVANIRTPVGRKLRAEARSQGGPLLRYRERDLTDAGVQRVLDRVVGTRDGMPVLDDGRVVEVTNVVWCTGFRQDFSWIDVPVFADDGWPVERRGVTAADGLYFAGLAFQSSFRSMLIGGAGHDAAHVARRLTARMVGRSGDTQADERRPSGLVS